MAKHKAVEVPSVTKPMGKPGDERIHKNPDLSKLDRPTKINTGYSGVGKKSVQGGDGKEREMEKKDLMKFERPTKINTGYNGVGKKSVENGDGKERVMPKQDMDKFDKHGGKKNPFKK